METSPAVEGADRRRIRGLFVEGIHMRDGVKETLCPQKVSGSGTLVETQSERTNQSIDRVIAVGAVVLEIAIPALGTEAVMGR